MQVWLFYGSYINFEHSSINSKKSWAWSKEREVAFCCPSSVLPACLALACFINKYSCLPIETEVWSCMWENFDIFFLYKSLNIIITKIYANTIICIFRFDEWIWFEFRMWFEGTLKLCPITNCLVGSSWFSHSCLWKFTCLSKHGLLILLVLNHCVCLVSSLLFRVPPSFWFLRLGGVCFLAE